MKTTLLTLSIIFFANLFAQNVSIPDANFKNYLVNNTLINTNGDNEIQVSEATSFTQSVYCPSLGITDLTGIEAFTNITELYCGFNQLTSLDVSQNTALVYLYCYSNQLTCLNVKNGNNQNFIFFNGGSNPDLQCIQVDNAAYSSTNWTYIDPTATFNENCPSDCGTSVAGINELKSSKSILKILDLLGRETTFKTNTPLILIYDNGSIEKVFGADY
jgi:Leucine-rich repeat (LRR) protein